MNNKNNEITKNVNNALEEDVGSGDVTTDAESFLKEYERVESDPLAGIGQFTGIRQMDEALNLT